VRLVRVQVARAAVCRPRGAATVNFEWQNWLVIQAAFRAAAATASAAMPPSVSDPPQPAAAAAAVYCVGEAVLLKVGGRVVELEVVTVACKLAEPAGPSVSPTQTTGSPFAVGEWTDVLLDLC
jgi:hypothetical protein